LSSISESQYCSAAAVALLALLLTRCDLFFLKEAPQLDFALLLPLASSLLLLLLLLLLGACCSNSSFDSKLSSCLSQQQQRQQQ
jgi:hypothetical protein